jgi:tetratricopeptide (TPR) repeat protein
VLRATLALQRSRVVSGAQASAWVDTGLRLADSALAIDPRDAGALATRGTLRFELVARSLTTDPTEERASVRDAESDLLRATELDPAQANAWNVLSALYYRKSPPDITGAHINARRALEADAYLAAADEVIWRLVATSYDLGEHDEAAKWCNEGRRRFPGTSRFVLCDLYIAFMPGVRPDIGRLWRDADSVVALTPAPRRALITRQVRLLTAISLATVGQTDSARHVLAAAKWNRTVDPEGVLVAPEALVHERLGERAAAVALLKQFLSEHPEHRAGLLRNTWWWSDLERDPDFRALAGTR